MSQKVKNDLCTFTQKPAQFVPHPLYDHFGERLDKNLARKKLHIDNTPFVFLFFGFIRKYKGLQMLIDAVASLHKEGIVESRNIRILVAGEFYENQEPYFEAIRQKQLEPYFFLHTHFIPDSDIPFYLSASDVIVQPYLHATQSGVTPLAYHFEVPMIVTRVGALPDMVPDSVGKVCEPDAASLAKAMKEMTFSNLEAMKKVIHTEKQQYSWERIVDTILSLAKT